MFLGNHFLRSCSKREVSTTREYLSDDLEIRVKVWYTVQYRDTNQRCAPLVPVQSKLLILPLPPQSCKFLIPDLLLMNLHWASHHISSCNCQYVNDRLQHNERLQHNDRLPHNDRLLLNDGRAHNDMLLNEQQMPGNRQTAKF